MAQLAAVERVVLTHPGSIIAMMTGNEGHVLTVLGDPSHPLIGKGGSFFVLADVHGLKRIQLPLPFAQPTQPQLLLQTIVVTLGAGVEDGRYVEAIAPPWPAIASEIERNPDFLNYFSKYHREFEEFLAGAYTRAGYSVILTPQRGDGGRDLIATLSGFGSVKILDQAKAYSPGHLVDHDDVRAMLGVLSAEPSASKGVITTTSDFQPGIYTSRQFTPFMPTRLELKNGSQLREWIIELRASNLR